MMEGGLGSDCAKMKWLASLQVFPGEKGRRMAELTWATTKEVPFPIETMTGVVWSSRSETDLKSETIPIRDEDHLKQLKKLLTVDEAKS
jgi:hypothetical protein